MQRRAFLANLGAIGTVGVAGCANPLAKISGGAGHPVELTLADVDTVLSEVGVDIQVELLESTVTDSEPARLRVTTTNTGPKRTVGVGDGRCGLFNRSAGGSDSPAGLWLYTKRRSDKLVNRFDARDGDRWVEDKAMHDSRGYDGYGCRYPTYRPGDEIGNEYVVWDDYRTLGYFDPGTYRWEESVTVTPPDSVDGPDGSTSFNWGFSLRVE